jgi:GAF domain-containing protein
LELLQSHYDPNFYKSSAGWQAPRLRWQINRISWFDRGVTSTGGVEARAQAERGLSALELLAQLRHAERVSEALRDVGIALGTTFDLDDLLELILSKLTELVEADRATLYLLDEVNNELVSRMVVGEQVQSIRMRVGHGIAGLVAETGRALRVKDAYNDPRFERDWDVLTGYRTSSILAAPLKNHVGRTIGVIQILNKRGADEFTTEDEAILSALSTQAAVAIDNSRLFLSLIQKNKQLLDTKGELERRLRDLSLLFELERATGRATSLEDLARAMLSLSAKSTEARGAALLVAEEESGDLVQYVYDPATPDGLQRIGVKAGEGLLAAAMSRNRVLHVAVGDRWGAGFAAGRGVGAARRRGPFWRPGLARVHQGGREPDAAGGRQRIHGGASVLRQPGARARRTPDFDWSPLVAGDSRFQNAHDRDQRLRATDGGCCRHEEASRIRRRSAQTVRHAHQHAARGVGVRAGREHAVRAPRLPA